MDKFLLDYLEYNDGSYCLLGLSCFANIFLGRECKFEFYIDPYFRSKSTWEEQIWAMLPLKMPQQVFFLVWYGGRRADDNHTLCVEINLENPDEPVSYWYDATAYCPLWMEQYHRFPYSEIIPMSVMKVVYAKYRKFGVNIDNMKFVKIKLTTL